jgi:hypothetical protein
MRVHRRSRHKSSSEDSGSDWRRLVSCRELDSDRLCHPFKDWAKFCQFVIRSLPPDQQRHLPCLDTAERNRVQQFKTRKSDFPANCRHSGKLDLRFCNFRIVVFVPDSVDAGVDDLFSPRSIRKNPKCPETHRIRRDREHHIRARGFFRQLPDVRILKCNAMTFITGHAGRSVECHTGNPAVVGRCNGNRQTAIYENRRRFALEQPLSPSNSRRGVLRFALETFRRLISKMMRGKMMEQRSGSSETAAAVHHFTLNDFANAAVPQFDPPAHRPTSRVSASPNCGSLTSMRSIRDRYRLQSFRLSSPLSV